jgi:predicted TIM-barrel fold metal-dependent hydrolase
MRLRAFWARRRGAIARRSAESGRNAKSEAAMKPIIDVHEHIFRGRDIPLRGYLYARTLQWHVKPLAWFVSRTLARCVRRHEEAKRHGIICHILFALVRIFLGKGYLKWAEILSLREIADIADRLVSTFSKDGVELYVPLVVDYEYWFKNTRDAQIKDQIDAISREIVIPRKGAIHPFVPFDPARELAHRAGFPMPDERQGVRQTEYGSLALVKEAIRKKGFIGVKLYNALGYRPIGNREVNDKQKRIFRDNGMERYAVFSGDDFDAVLFELYQFCAQEQVPITTHCACQSIEAYDGASFDFGDPCSWRGVLDMLPELHLNLAHFGWTENQRYLDAGSRSLQRRGGEKTWVTRICEMLRDYPNLYVDVSHHELMARHAVSRFASDYRAMFQDFPRLLQKRLLYGVDWHVITRAGRFENFMDLNLRVLREAGFTSEEIEDFLGGNALRFLGLLPLGTPPSDGWSENRRRLKDFYAANAIAPQAWFTSTG